MSIAIALGFSLLFVVTLIIRRSSRARFSQREWFPAWAFSLLAGLLIVHIIDLCTVAGWTIVYCWRNLAWPSWTNSLTLAACIAGLVSAGFAGDKLDHAIRISDNRHRAPVIVLFVWSLLTGLSSIYMLGFTWCETGTVYSGQELKPTDFYIVLGLFSTLPWLPLFCVDVIEWCYSTIAEWLFFGR